MKKRSIPRRKPLRKPPSLPPRKSKALILLIGGACCGKTTLGQMIADVCLDAPSNTWTFAGVQALINAGFRVVITAESIKPVFPNPAFQKLITTYNPMIWRVTAIA